MNVFMPFAQPDRLVGYYAQHIGGHTSLELVLWWRLFPATARRVNSGRSTSDRENHD